MVLFAPLSAGRPGVGSEIRRCFLQLGLRRQLVQRRTGSHALSREHTAARFHKKLGRAKCLRRFSKRVLTMKKQKELEGLCAQDQKEIKRLKQKLRRKEKAMAEAAALLIALKKIQAFWGEPRTIDVACRPAVLSRDPLSGHRGWCPSPCEVD